MDEFRGRIPSTERKTQRRRTASEGAAGDRGRACKGGRGWGGGYDVCDGGLLFFAGESGLKSVTSRLYCVPCEAKQVYYFHTFYVVLHCKFGMRADGPSAAKPLSESLLHWARILSLHQPEVGNGGNRSRIRKLNLCIKWWLIIACKHAHLPKT